MKRHLRALAIFALLAGIVGGAVCAIVLWANLVRWLSGGATWGFFVLLAPILLAVLYPIALQIERESRG